ncbi:MAG: group III truncated hemoglobin [Ilumatobacter sp.]|uniref:group III truncated hemoglobin n=1 Tax=Ilumatobacter sp. TaxID=1967498 RepID=UPI00391C0F57
MIVHPLTDDDLANRSDLLTRDDVELLVRSFYRYAAMDELLGPIFAAAHVAWDDHVATLTDFWAWQLLGERGYTGQPLRAHEPVQARTPFADAHYERWLDLFVSTVDEHFVGDIAELAKHRATKMASALRKLLNGEHGAANEPIELTFATSPAAPCASAPTTYGGKHGR